MSHTPSPIGSVEFIVKFESMQKEFTDALKEAIEDADITVSGEGGVSDSRKLDEILFNLRNRIRQPFTGDRLNFLYEAQPHMEFFRDPKTRDQLQQWFISEIVGKRMLPKGEDEDTEDYKVRVQKVVDSFLDGTINMIQAGISDPQFWREHALDYVDISSGFQSALKGDWNYIMRTVFRKVIKEYELEDVLRESARANAFENIRAFSKQKQRSKILGDIGTGETPISSTEEFMKAFIKETGFDTFMKRVEDVEVENKEEYEEALEKFKEKYTVVEGTLVPNQLVKDLGGTYSTAAGDYKRLDLSLFLEGIKGLEEFKKWAKQYDLPSAKKFDEWAEELKQQIEDFGAAVVQFEGKLEATENLEAISKGKYGGTTKLFSMMGMPMLQIIPEYKLKSSEESAKMIMEAMKNFFGDSIDYVLTAAGTNQKLLEQLVDRIKENPDLAKQFKGVL